MNNEKITINSNKAFSNNNSRQFDYFGIELDNRHKINAI